MTRTALPAAGSQGRRRGAGLAGVGLVVGGLAVALGVAVARPGGAADAPAPTPPAPDRFVSLGEGSAAGVSGLAVLEDGPDGALDVLVAHDGKGPTAPRLSRLTLGRDGAVLGRAPVAWPDAHPPVDLEAAAAVPGRPGHVLLLTSGGGLWHVVVRGPTLEVVSAKAVRRGKLDLEGLALLPRGDRVVVAWADRGAGPTPATLWLGTWDATEGFVRGTEVGRVAVPWPDPTSPATRHVADLGFDDAGVLFGVASHDPGDAGPFQGALYALGAVGDGPDGPTWRGNPAPVPLERYARKPEALVLRAGPDGGVMVGTDDEALGGAVRRR